MLNVSFCSRRKKTTTAHGIPCMCVRKHPGISCQGHLLAGFAPGISCQGLAQRYLWPGISCQGTAGAHPASEYHGLVHASQRYLLLLMEYHACVFVSIPASRARATCWLASRPASHARASHSDTSGPASRARALQGLIPHQSTMVSCTPRSDTSCPASRARAPEAHRASLAMLSNVLWHSFSLWFKPKCGVAALDGYLRAVF